MTHITHPLTPRTRQNRHQTTRDPLINCPRIHGSTTPQCATTSFVCLPKRRHHPHTRFHPSPASGSSSAALDPELRSPSGRIVPIFRSHTARARRRSKVGASRAAPVWQAQMEGYRLRPEALRLGRAPRRLKTCTLRQGWRTCPLGHHGTLPTTTTPAGSVFGLRRVKYAPSIDSC